MMATTETRPRAIVPREVAGLAGATTWATLPEDERKRRATLACQDHDTVALWGLCDAWLTLHGKPGARVSAHTRRSYRTGVHALVAAWRHENLLHPRRDAGALWLRGLEGAGLAPATVAVRLAAARSLYSALRWSGATTADPLRDARAAPDPTPPWEKREPYTDDEIDALLRHAGPGDRALLLLGAHGGLRVSEILALTWADVDLARRRVVVRAGKGGKRRRVELSASATEALQALRDLCAPGPEEPGREDVEDAGTAPVLSAYRTTTRARARLARLCKHAGVPYKGVHALRHSCGTRLVGETGDLEMAARHLGHSTIEMTRTYAKWNNKALREKMGAW
jgi:integrase